MKTCSKCLVEKPLEQFSKRNGGKFGSVCKVCTAKYQREVYNQKVEEISIRRAVTRLNQIINTWDKKASRAGFKLSIAHKGEFVVSLEEHQ